MLHFLKYQLFGIPVLVWGLQLLYVAAMLGLLVVLVQTTNLNHRSTRTILTVVIPYVIVMIALDIIWRTALKHYLPNWF